MNIKSMSQAYKVKPNSRTKENESEDKRNDSFK